TSPELTQLIFRGEFLRLRICHLGKCEPIILSSSMTIQQLNFRQLTIREQNGHEFETILLASQVAIRWVFRDVDMSFPMG
ncbi:unnamed protein product, partial [Rotaria sp. Silwood2]